MKLTAKASYAGRALTELAKAGKGDWTKSKDLAEKIDVSSDFLAQISLDLKKAGLIDSQRGAGGGIKLGKAPEEINLKEIIEAVEGKIALKNCFENEEACGFYHQCPFVQSLKEGQDRMLAVYERKTLAEIVEKGEENV